MNFKGQVPLLILSGKVCVLNSESRVLKFEFIFTNQYNENLNLKVDYSFTISCKNTSGA